MIGSFIDPIVGVDKPLGNHIGVAFTGASSNNLVGGSVNTISGNDNIGVAFHDELTYLNRVEGNLIGPDPTGTKAVVRQVDANTDVPVQTYGVGFYGGAGNLFYQLGNTLGGTTARSRNIITGNVSDGVAIQGVGTQYNVVEGNFIGTDVTGSDYLKDPYHPPVHFSNGGSGVNLSFSANDNIIGGTADGTGNTIAFNQQNGVRVNASTGDAILGNAIFANGRFNIELPNGGNDSQVPPLLTSATSDGSQITITGTFFGSPNTEFRLEFFSSGTASPPEGRYFLGVAQGTTDDSGQADFTITLPVGADQGQFITATATNPGNNTSQFSPSVAVDSAGP